MDKITRFLLNILGPYSPSVFYGTKQRFLNLLLLILFITFSFSLFENLLLGNLEYAIISASSSLFAGFMYYLSRFKRIFQPVAIAVFVYLLFLLSPILWHEKGLAKTSLSFLFLLILAFSVYIFEGRVRLIFVASSLMMMVAFSVGDIINEKGRKLEFVNYSIALILTAVALLSVGYYSINRFKKEKEKAENISKHDYLTQLLTRREGMDRFRCLIKYSKRTNRDLSMIMMDLDDFKRVNDTYGHICGDHVLRQVAKSIKKCIRQTDIAMRWGGEEFLVILPETNRTKAYMIAERIRKDIENTNFECAKNEFKVTITCGVTMFDHSLEEDENIEKADQALYKGKRSGKNKTVVI